MTEKSFNNTYLSESAKFRHVLDQKLFSAKQSLLINIDNDINNLALIASSVMSFMKLFLEASEIYLHDSFL